MNIKSKNVLPKAQMIVNGILSQRQNTQLNFNKEEYSLQIKNHNLLTINWYEPQLQDIQWSIEFLGIKSLKHVSMSYNKRRKVRLLFWSLNVLHFFEGQIRSRQSSLNLRKNLIRSQKLINLNIENTDDILLISQDLFPQKGAGIFLICTLKKEFYVLKANSVQYELIELNCYSRIERFLRSMSGLISKPVVEDEQYKGVISNILIKLSIDNEQSFKSIIVQGFSIQIRLISIPIIPGQKCRQQISLLHEINIKQRVCNELSIINEQMSKKYLLVWSNIYQTGNIQVNVLHLMRNINQLNQYIIISTCVQYQTGLIKNIHHLRIYQNQLNHLQILQVNDFSLSPDYIILKGQFQLQSKSHILLKLVHINNLIIQHSHSFYIQGNTLLTSSDRDHHLILLSSYKIYDINHEMKGQSNHRDSNQMVMMQQQHQQVQRSSKIKQIGTRFSLRQHEIQKNLRNKNYQKIQLLLKELCQSIKVSIGQQTTELVQLLRMWTSIQMYNILIRLQVRFNNKKLYRDEIKFNDILLAGREYRQIQRILRNMISDGYYEQCLMVWIQLLGVYKSEQLIMRQRVRVQQCRILDNEFGDIINVLLQKSIKSKQQLLMLQQCIMNVIRLCSGIIRIQKDIYRQLIQSNNNNILNNNNDMINNMMNNDNNMINNDNNIINNNNNDMIIRLKQIAIQQYNYDIMSIIYFQYGQFNQLEVKSFLLSLQFNKYFKNNKIQQQFIKQFILQYLTRIQHNQIHHKSNHLYSLINILQHHLPLLNKILAKQHHSDIDILIALKLGQRQHFKHKILQISHQMKHNNNKNKLLLTIQDSYQHNHSNQMKQ